MAALIPHLSGELLQRILQIALTIQDEGYQAFIVATLAPHLSGELLQRILQIALAMQDREYQAQALVALTPYLGEEQREEALQRALQAVIVIQDDESQAQALTTFLPYINKIIRLRYTIYKVIANLFWKNLVKQQRKDVLHFLATKENFQPSLLDYKTVSSVAQSIRDICFEWRWL